MEQEIPRLSASVAHRLLSVSPLEAWAKHRLLGGQAEAPPTASQLEGRLWHAMLLEGGAGVEVIDAKDFRTNAAKEKRDLAAAEGKIPVTALKFQAMQPAVKAIEEEMLRFGIEFGSQKVEHRIEWEEQTINGDDVACSGFVDTFKLDRGWLDIYDLKTGSSGTSIDDAVRLIANSHSLLQEPAYRSGLSDQLGIDRERSELTYVFVQTEAPYSVTPVTLSGDFREMAEIRWRRALEIWNRCLTKGTGRECWPGPVENITPISAPGWLLAKELELEAMSDA
jgi:hypothetical protein